jgi:hypothetical protein
MSEVLHRERVSALPCYLFVITNAGGNFERVKLSGTHQPRVWANEVYLFYKKV